MNFLPIMQRELGVRARAPATYWIRLAIGFIGIAICVPPVVFSGPFSTPGTIGKGMFAGIITAAFILSCCAGFLTVSSVHTEQREGTLGLIFLTRVSLLDVLLGKLGSIGLTSLCALVAFSPILMLPVLAGGVTGGEAARQTLVLLNTMFYSLAIGLFAAAGQPALTRAARAAAVLLLVGVFVPAPFWRLTGELKHAGLASPLISLLCASDSNYSPGSAWEYWLSLLIVHALGWFWLGLAATRLRRGFREPIAPVRRQSRRWSDIPAAPPRPWQTLAGNTTPIQWLVHRQPGLLASVWAAAVVDLLMRTLLIFPLLRTGGYFYYLVPSLVTSALSGALIAWAASRFFIDARRSGQLEQLLTTPVGAQSIVSDQWKALLQVLVWPVVVMLMPAVLRFLGTMLTTRGVAVQGLTHALMYGPVHLVFEIAGTLLSVGALVWLGLFFGYRSRSQAAAICWSVAAVRGLPFAFTFLANIALSLLGGPFSSTFHYLSVFLLIPLAWLTGVWWLIRIAQRGLAAHLRGSPPREFRESLQATRKIFRAALQKVREWPPPTG